MKHIHTFICLLLLVSSVATPAWAEMPDELYETMIGHLKSKEFEEGYRIAKFYADRGSVKSYVILAQMHMNGDFVKQDKAVAKYYFQLASDNGDGYASGELSLLAGSESEAFGYQYLGAHQGDVGAAVGLMFSYFYGKGTATNDLLAAKWLNAKTLMVPWTDEEIEKVRETLHSRLPRTEMDTAWAMAWNFVYLQCKCGWNQKDFENDNPDVSGERYYLSDEFMVTDGSLRVSPRED